MFKQDWTRIDKFRRVQVRIDKFRQKKKTIFQNFRHNEYYQFCWKLSCDWISNTKEGEKQRNQRGSRCSRCNYRKNHANYGQSFEVIQLSGSTCCLLHFGLIQRRMWSSNNARVATQENTTLLGDAMTHEKKYGLTYCSVLEEAWQTLFALRDSLPRILMSCGSLIKLFITVD